MNVIFFSSITWPATSQENRFYLNWLSFNWNSLRRKCHNATEYFVLPGSHVTIFFSAGSVADVTEIRPDSGDLLPAPVRFPKSATFQQDLLFRYFTEKKKTIWMRPNENSPQRRNVGPQKCSEHLNPSNHLLNENIPMMTQLTNFFLVLFYRPIFTEFLLQSNTRVTYFL